MASDFSIKVDLTGNYSRDVDMLMDEIALLSVTIAELRSTMVGVVSRSEQELLDVLEGQNERLSQKEI